MAIESFTTTEFMDALLKQGYPVLDCYLEMGEYCFDIPYKNINIHVRSSIGENGKSDGVGENSIRVYMRTGTDYLGKIDAYTTRVPGWADRLAEKIDELKRYRDLSGDCPTCKKPMGVYKVKKQNQNFGRLFARCEKDDVFFWLDEMTREVLFNTVNVEGGVFEAVLEQLIAPAPLVVEPALDTSLTLEQLSAPLSQSEQLKQAVLEAHFEVKYLPESLDDVLAMLPEDEVTVRGDPNSFQVDIINAPLDQPLRVLAGPGSGKTWTITRRYTRMVVDLQITPNQIVVVTFNKLAADNMLKKIVEQCPVPPDAMNQISTIHALCNRSLRNYYKDFAKLEMASIFAIEKIIKGLLVRLEPVEDVRPG